MEPTRFMLERVFEFLPIEEMQRTLSELVEGRDISDERLLGLEAKAKKYHVETQFEDIGYGYQSLNHYAWTNVFLGNAAAKGGLKPDKFYLEAWKTFVDGGNDDNGHKLVKENPYLIDDPRVMTHYLINIIHAQRLIEIAPELRRHLPHIAPKEVSLGFPLKPAYQE